MRNVVGVTRQTLGMYKRRRTELRTYRLNREKIAAQMRLRSEVEFPFGREFPCLEDRRGSAGVAAGHYFHQDLWVAQRIAEAAPRRHVDVGSRIDGVVAHAASFRRIEVLDFRPATSSAANITFRQMDLVGDVADYLASTDSLACLHALEHFGLGRYGDPVEIDGWRLGLNRLIDMLEPGGTQYLAVPVGPQRVEFDAHRVFTIPLMRAKVSRQCKIREFALIDDTGELHTNLDPVSEQADASFGCKYGSGVFVAARAT